MKSKFKILIMLFLCLFCFGISSYAQGIKWAESLSWEQINAKAKAENKYIFVDCYATWCGPCKQMDKDVYPLAIVGETINEKFISVKVQMDSTKSDSENIKKYYPVARIFEKTYSITGLPTYLFFSPGGEVVHKAMGFQKPGNFIQLVKDVQLPEKQVYSQIKACREGKMDLNLVRGFIQCLNDSVDKEIALELARLYMKNYLEDLPEAKFVTKDNLLFFIKYLKMLSSDDKIFALSYKKPKMIDSINNNPGLANNLIKSILFHNVIQPEFEIAKKNKREPNWNSLKTSLDTKGDKNLANEIIFDAKHSWYITIKDWDKACEYAIIKFQRMDLKTLKEAEVCDELNTIAWTLFQYSFKKKQLEQGLIWIDEALSLDGTGRIPTSWLMDTKSNLLYKLGRRKEAIALQEKAVLLLESKMESKNHETLLHVALNKMKLGKPTWPSSEIGVDEKKQVK